MCGAEGGADRGGDDGVGVDGCGFGAVGAGAFEGEVGDAMMFAARWVMCRR